MSERVPVVAIVGRQNVGKSTLANRLLGRREAIAHEMPGVTRDRIELDATWRGRTFRLVDTGGYLNRARGLEAEVARQAERAAEAADLVVLVVDAQTGPTEEDAMLARRLRRAPVSVVVAVNKVDAVGQEPEASAFARLGLGEPLPVSALHGRGSGDLLDRLVALLPDAPSMGTLVGEPRFAIVGRPNVGKSSLFNRLVGEQRSVVYEEAGTTRDAVDALVRWPGGTVRFVDTAGLRRASKARAVEYYSFLRAERAIERAHVGVLVIDAAAGFTAEDRRIAAKIVDAGRALVVVANKWDLVDEREPTYRALAERAQVFARADVVRASALRGAGVHRLPPLLVRLHERWSARVSTAEVNRVLERTQAERPAPSAGRYRYATQVAAGPPTFVVFAGETPDATYVRFLENRFRRAFELDGVPIRFRFRRRRESKRR